MMLTAKRLDEVLELSANYDRIELIPSGCSVHLYSTIIFVTLYLF